MKIRVLEVLASLKRAGAERLVVSLACGLDPVRFDIEVVSLYDAFPSGFEPLLEEHNIPIRHLGKRHGLDPRMYPRLAAVYRAFKPDIVHTHSYLLRYTWPAGWFSGAPGPRMIHTVHNLADREVNRLGQAINRAAFRHGVVPVAVSREVADSFRRVYGSDPAATIPNGIDTDSFYRPQAREPWRRAHGFSPEDRLVVSVARLEPQKNPLGLIESFAQALGERGRWHLLLAGDGSLTEAARELATTLGIAGRVHFLGTRDDIPDVLAASDVFGLASHWEGNPMSVMEAMAAGLPVAASAVGGVPELIEDGVSGVLAPPGNVAALAAALASLAGDPQRARDLAAAARREAAQFGVATMVSAYAQFFECVAGRASGPAAGGLACEPFVPSGGAQRHGHSLTAAPRTEAAPALRIALLSTNLARGGAEAQVAQLARALQRRGCAVSVISLLEPTAFQAELAASGVRVFSLGMRPGRPAPRAFVRLASILRELRPQVLHAHLFHANLAARALRLLCPVPVVISTIHSIAESARSSAGTSGRDWLYRITDRLSDATTSVSAAGAQRYASIRAVAPGRLRVIPNGVDTERFRPDTERRERTRSGLGLRNEFVWLAAGRLMWKKDYATMLRAIACRYNSGRAAIPPSGTQPEREGAGPAVPTAPREEVLLIAGEGPQEAELRALASELGVNARFLGARDDIPDLMTAGDGLLLSSVVEGLPMVLLEAAAAGLPCVATSVGGVAEAVLDGRTGFLVPPGDAPGFANAMARLAELPPDARQQMARAAREHARSRFDLAVVVEQWERLYIELINASRD